MARGPSGVEVALRETAAIRLGCVAVGPANVAVTVACDCAGTGVSVSIIAGVEEGRDNTCPLVALAAGTVVVAGTCVEVAVGDCGVALAGTPAVAVRRAGGTLPLLTIVACVAP